MISVARSKEMFSSCPSSALVDGVKIGSGNSADSVRPAGKGIPHTVWPIRYSFHPDPDR